MIPNSPSRLHYLDWARGFAAVIMLQGHVFHAFTRSDLRGTGPYIFSQFLGGMPPAIFLFLTGLTLAFLMDSLERQGISSSSRVIASLRRAGYLFAIAFAFRLQLWLFAYPKSAWTDIFRVDILNCMGFALAIMALMAVFQTVERVRLCAGLGLAIAVASPLVSELNWSHAPPIVKAYLAPDLASFGFFPWAAFVAFGLSAGSVLRLISREQTDRAMLWMALLGSALIMGAQYLSSSPYSLYPKSDFWLNSPCMILTKLGVILLLVPFAFLWSSYAGQSWSWVRQFGVTSLLVYWVHIELVYGRWLPFLKESLNVGQTIAAAVALILLMLGLSVAKTSYKRWVAGLAGISWYSSSIPKRVSGE